MRNHSIVALSLLLACFTAGCSGKIELVGYGNRPGIQHGLKVALLNLGPSGATIEITNTSDDVLSVNQNPQAIEVSVKMRKGDNLVPVPPCEVIFVDMNPHPQADDFVLLAPGQTRNIPVPVSYKANRYRTLYGIYRIEKDYLYEVEVRLMPYFGTFTEKTAGQTLASFKIPNYSHEPLTMNTMIIRAR